MMTDHTERQAAYEKQLKDRNAALAAIGFGPVFAVGEVFGRCEFATCETCGAAVAILPAEPNDKQPVFTHRAWHQEQPAPEVSPFDRAEADLTVEEAAQALFEEYRPHRADPSIDWEHLKPIERAAFLHQVERNRAGRIPS